MTIKLSGDGAPFYHSSKYILLSFSFPLLGEDSLSSEGIHPTLKCSQSIIFIIGNHIFAIFSGQEKYEVLKEGFAPVLAEINSLIERSVIHIDGSILDVRFILGGDYKVEKMLINNKCFQMIHVVLIAIDGT